MKKIFLISLLLCCTSSFAQFSNMIVFGDSLSDSGNFPESSQIWWHANAKKDLRNSVAQFYVPFSNPVTTKTNNPYLEKQAPIENDPHIRKYRSISWPQYFLITAHHQKLFLSDNIAPSELFSTRKIPHNISFNYAWGYATSEKQCVNPHYQLIKNCDANSITQARKNYVKNPSKQSYLKLEIPGLPEQVQLFLQDNRAHKVSVNKNTVYTFWIGGNDLIVAANALRHHFNIFPAITFMLGSVEKNEIETISTLIKHLPKNQRPKNIYVMELFNPGLTPGFYHTPLAGIGNFAVKCSNFWLHVDAKLFNVFSSTKIVVVPVYSLYAKAAANKAFQAHLGQACQLDGGDYAHATHIPKSHCVGFMFWNAVHPASSMNQRVAQLLLDWISFET